MTSVEWMRRRKVDNRLVENIENFGLAENEPPKSSWLDEYRDLMKKELNSIREELHEKFEKNDNTSR